MPRSPLPAPQWRNRITELRYVSPQDLEDHPLQWRVHPDQQRSALRGILEEVGIAGALLAYVSPATGRLVSIDGHLRKSLGNTPWPTLILDVTDEEAALLLATHDPLSALAEASQDQLTALLHEVQSGDSAVQQMLSELAQREGIVPLEGIGHHGTEVVEPEIPIDRLDAVVERWGVAEGNLWILGDHRLLCASSLDPTSWEQLLESQVPDFVFADPPYGVDIVATNGYVGGGEAYDIPFGGVKHSRRRTHVGGWQRQKDVTGQYPIESWQKDGRGSDGAAKPFGSKSARGQVGNHASKIVAVGKYAPIIGDDSSATAIQASTYFLTTYPKAVHVWWGGNYYADHLPASSCWLVWDKDTTGNFADCELAWTNQPKAARLFHHRWNGMLRASEHERRWHPTQKPAALALWAYETLGKVGDVVLDPFVGSGPSLLAAEQSQRRVFGCELSPENVAIVLERWHLLTGQTPHLMR